METYMIFMLIVLLFTLVLMIRNEMVASYRIKVIDLIFSTDDWQEKNLIYNGVDYDRMVWQFWKPLKSFFPEDWKV